MANIQQHHPGSGQYIMVRSILLLFNHSSSNEWGSVTSGQTHYNKWVTVQFQER